MQLACCIWALPGSDEEKMAQAVRLGFRRLDIQPGMFRQAEQQERLAQSGISISCVAAAFGLPDGAALESADSYAVAEARRHFRSALDHAAHLKAQAAYILPASDHSKSAQLRYAQEVVGLADYAAELGLRLCIEHFPGFALPTIAETLAWLQSVDHPNLYLLLDTGHAQISAEICADAIAAAGSRLGYVHLDDNDGQADLHLALLDGILTGESLQKTLLALDEVGYTGGVSLELHPSLPDPADALARSLRLLQEYGF